MDGPSRSTRGPKKPAESLYGGGSVKKNGVYDELTALLAQAGKEIVEFSGITGRVRTLHAHTLPIDMWIPTAAMAVSQRFLFIKKSLHF